MSQADERRKIEYLLSALAALVLLGYLLLYAAADFGSFDRLAMADMYADTLVARLMWEAKTLFPKRFLFGNQFYVLATPVLSALFYGLTGSMNRAMALATTLMSLLLLLSLAWMLRPFVRQPMLRWAAALAAVGLFFGPSAIRREDGPQLFYVMCSYYACYAITNFVVLGDYARARRDARLRLPALLLGAVLCLAMGMQSPRQTCVTVLPLLCLEGLRLLLRLRKKEGLLPAGARMPLLRVGVYALANAAGLVLIRLIGARKHTIYTGSSIFSGASLLQKLRETHGAIGTVTGLVYTHGENSPLFFSLMFAFCIALVLGAAWLLIFRRRAEDEALAAFWWLSLIACAGVILASLVTRVSIRAIYLFPWYFMPALSFVIVARRLKPRAQAALTAALICLCAANLYFSYRLDVEAMRDPNPTPSEQVCAYALDHGFELVYGLHSHSAPAIALASDGKLLAGCWEEEVPYKITPYINLRDIYYLSDYQRAIFVFTDTEEGPMTEEARNNGAELTFCGQFGYYHVYTSSQQLLWPISETIDWKPEYN